MEGGDVVDKRKVGSVVGCGRMVCAFKGNCMGRKVNGWGVLWGVACGVIGGVTGRGADESLDETLDKEIERS